MEKKRNYKRKTVLIKCDHCGKMFEKVESEVKRNSKNGRHNYCSRDCSVRGAAASRTGKKRGQATGKSLEHLKEICGNRRDRYTPYRYTYRCIKSRFQDIDITIDDLVAQWEKQKGICPYTGYRLILPENGNIKKIDFFHRASLDRIDSSKGYIRGNIQFVSTPINLLKQEQNDADVKKFLKDISLFTSKL